MQDARSLGKQRLEAALNRNAVALGLFDSLLPGEKRELELRAGRLSSEEEVRALVDGMVGWKEGHAPYQL